MKNSARRVCTLMLGLVFAAAAAAQQPSPIIERHEGDVIVFARGLGIKHNAVVLPAGWSVTASSIPAVVTMTDDGRVRLDYDNPRPDEIAVLLRGRRR